MESYSAEFEEKRRNFRKYLEDAGFVGALSEAFCKLYHEKSKPEDGIMYVRQWICETCPTEDQYEDMRQQLRSSYFAVADLERETEYEKNNIIPTKEELEKELLDAYKELNDDTSVPPSLLVKHMTKDIIEKYKHTKTKQDPTTTLINCLRAGLAHHDDPVGIYPANSECYTVFNDLFLPIVKELHGKDTGAKTKAKALQPKADFGDVNQVSNLDPKKKYVARTFISLSRNVIGFTFLSRITYQKCMDFEKRMKKGLPNLQGEFAGTYTPLIDIELDVQKEMADRKALFTRNNAYLVAAGVNHYYPFGRGVFLNNKETFGVWVNAKDHITIFAKEENGNLGKCYKRVVEGSKLVEKACKLRFYNHKSFGFITADLRNLGTGMLVSVELRLPNLQLQTEYLEGLAAELSIVIQGLPTEEDIKEKDLSKNIITVTNKSCLGSTEIAIILLMQDAVSQLISLEETLAKKKLKGR